MKLLKKPKQFIGWLTFFITLTVYFFSIERTGSLWDCGEFITGAYKLEVVHPPGAPLFMIIGRMFTYLAELFSDNPADIALSVNLMSAICSSFTAMFVSWITISLGKLALIGRKRSPNKSEIFALLGGGLVAGLSTAFCTSIWFSAVEAEVYAMSTMFTALTLWAIVKWYEMPNKLEYDRWLILAIFSMGLSMGVHLLSILVFPFLTLIYYLKKYPNTKIKGIILSIIIGLIGIVFLQKIIITGIPTLWSKMELLAVNGLGLPFHSGLFFVLAILFSVIYIGLYHAHKYKNGFLQKIIIAISLIITSFSIFGVIIIRADSNTPINMNTPNDAMRLLPYLNREQYGERPLLYGTNFDASPIRIEEEDRYGRVGNNYQIIDKKTSFVYDDKDKVLLPRMGDGSQGRPNLYRQWLNKPTGKLSLIDNIHFLFKYQFGWMYWRYFMWNFSGRQNGEQGYYSWNVKSGHWLSGFSFIDNIRLYNQDKLPKAMKEHQARNKYFMLPFLFGLIGLLFHLRKRKNDFIALLGLFIITGLGIIIYSNQPPSEPRERDYVLVGSFLTFSIWIGMAVLAFFELIKNRSNINSSYAALIAFSVTLIAPILMGFQNFDDHSRMYHTGARDYANNFLESCEPNAIIFTYGDNDTYPLWYAQEVENIRTDVRVVNLSLIAVDWYIDQLRRKVNDSKPIKMLMPRESYRGFRRNQLFIDPFNNGPRMNLNKAIKFASEHHPLTVSNNNTLESYIPTKQFYIPVNKEKVIKEKVVNDINNIVNEIEFNVDKNYLIKGELAVLDIIVSNLWERPIYFAVTVQEKSLLGLDNYLQMEGLGLKLVPIKTNNPPLVSGTLGKGRINADKVYENVMNKFKWGNFDKKQLFVDKSYAPSVQSHRFMLLRTIQEFIKRQENQKAVELIDKFFEAFPNRNFTYDYKTFYFIQAYITTGNKEKAIKHALILAKETADHLIFYQSLSPNKLNSGFANDQRLANNTKDNLINLSKSLGDAAFSEQINSIFQN
jgi:hypothetical protein